MSEHEVRPGGSGEAGSGELPGQENDEGPGGGPPSMGDDHSAADDATALDALPEPGGDPVERDDLAEAQEQADALRLEQVRATLAELAEPEGSPYDIEDETADDDDADEDDVEDYDEAEAEDYDELGEYEDESADDTEVESDYDGAGDGD